MKTKWWKKFLTWKQLDTYSQRGRLFTVVRDVDSLRNSFPSAVNLVEGISSTHVRFYVTPGWRLFPFLRPNSLDGIVAKSYGRFGNQILELACAHALAAEVGASTLFPQHPDPFRPGVHTIDGVVIHVSPGAVESNTLFALLPRFIAGLRPAIQIRGAMNLAWMENRGSVSPTPSPDVFEEIGKIIAWSRPTETLPDDQVVAHIRSGDVFSPPIDPGYGQPPLSYYQKCIKAQQWSKVWVVAEDNKNPVVDRLLSWLDDRGIPHEYFSKGFDEDVALIAAAKNIIASRGTFVPTVAAIAGKRPRVFFMEEEVLPVTIEETTNVKDTRGDYSAGFFNRNWSMNPLQLELMVTYPEENLHFESNSGADKN